MPSQEQRSPRLHDLEVSLAVHQHGTQEAAAEALEWNQSGVSRSIVRLETWLRTALTTGDRPAQLSAAGFLFVETAEKIVSLMYAARPELQTPAPAAPRKSGKDIRV